MMRSLKASYIKGKTLETMEQTRVCIMITHKKNTIFYRRVEQSFKSRSGPGVPGVAGVPDVSHLICEGALTLVSERRTFRHSYILGGAVRLGRKSHRLCLKMGFNHI